MPKIFELYCREKAKYDPLYRNIVEHLDKQKENTEELNLNNQNIN